MNIAHKDKQEMAIDEAIQKRSHLMRPKFAIAMLAVSTLGFIDAAYLTVQHYTAGFATCNLFGDCHTVTASHFATVLGVPVALVGALYYFLVLALCIAYFDTHRVRTLRFASLITPLGFVASLYFVYLQLFVLHAICAYCMVSAVSSTTLCLLGMSYLFFLRGKTP